MSGKTELFMFLTAAFGTIVGLFTAQEFFLSHHDILTHEAIDQAPANPELVALRQAEADALQSAPLPVEDAKRALAERGRGGFADIAPRASDDYSALSGWVHAKGFKPFVPPTPPPVVIAADPALPAGSLPAGSLPPGSVPVGSRTPTVVGAH